MRASFSSIEVFSLAAVFSPFTHDFIRTRGISSRCSNRNQAVFHRRKLQFGVCKSAPVSNYTVVALASQTGDQKNRSRRGRERAVILSESNGSFNASKPEFVVVSFYQFICFKDPESEINKHLEFLEDLDICGRIYINEQGINAQYSGPSKDALSYVEWLKEDERYSDILVQVSPALYGHAFPKLKVQFKPLVQLEGGISNLPLLDPSMRATPLPPSEWKNKLKAMNTSCKTSTGNPIPDRILLDVRNGYEWDIGHFREAKRPEVDCFRSTSFGLSESEEVVDSDPLADVDKENTEILMYCTGGIRCDVYSTILRNKGFKNLYTLEGGVSNYLENEGPIDWVGNLFVFDSRLSLPPSAYNPEAATTEAFALQQALEKDKFAKCYICGSLVHELRHRNCANIDCNLLFLCCPDCMDSVRGCCCSSCTTAPRLRPVLHSHQRYQKWHVYRDLDI